MSILFLFSRRFHMVLRKNFKFIIILFIVCLLIFYKHHQNRVNHISIDKSKKIFENDSPPFIRIQSYENDKVIEIPSFKDNNLQEKTIDKIRNIFQPKHIVQEKHIVQHKYDIKELPHVHEIHNHQDKNRITKKVIVQEKTFIQIEDINKKHHENSKYEINKDIQEMKRKNRNDKQNIIEIPPTQNKNTVSADVQKRLLSEISNIYMLSKENLLFILNKPNRFTDFKSDLFLKNSIASKDLIDLNLKQLSNIETLIKSLVSEESKKKLEQYVFNVIMKNQFPTILKDMEVNHCIFSKGCGFGCQMHHLIYCFTVSLAQGRPLIIDSNNWHGFSSFNDLFEPLYDKELENNKNVKKINKIPIIEESFYLTKYLPTTFPVEIKNNIQEFHRNPFLWWCGQLIKYILRFKPETKKKLKNMILEKPIVGVHIRRTDKIGTEANLHPIEDYMFWVDLYYRKLSLTEKFKNKNVYIATDEVGLAKKLIEKYPEYNFFTDEESTSHANNDRNTPYGSFGIISDVYNLARTDYIVCTFSSQVCRLAFEWMNGLQVDASENYKSLDEIYYFGGQKQRSFNLISDYENETKIDKSYRFNLKHNDWNGYSQIQGLDDNVNHHIPSYKIHENWLSHEFLAFKNYREKT